VPIIALEVLLEIQHAHIIIKKIGFLTGMDINFCVINIEHIQESTRDVICETLKSLFLSHAISIIIYYILRIFTAEIHDNINFSSE
jgi:hypothetical protein